MPNQANISALTEIKQKMSDSKSIIFADYTGLSVSAQTELRAKIKSVGGIFTVQKNTLLKIAVQEKLGEQLPAVIIEGLNGPTAVIYGLEDAITATKALVEFAKTHETLKIKMGVLSGEDGSDDKVLTVTEIENLAKLPGKEQLIAQLIGTLQAPISGFVNVTAANLRGLVTALDAIRKQKGN